MRAPFEDNAPRVNGPRGDAAAGLVVRRAIDLIGLPRPAEIIEGAAWAGCLSVLVSESGTGKTFVLLNAAAAVSAGGSSRQS